MKMKTEPFEAAEVPRAFNLRRDGETGESSKSIPDLIDELRTAFQSSVFDRVQDILMAREDNLNREIEKRKKEYELTRDSLGIARLEQRDAEEELKNFKAKFAENVEALRERATAAEERARLAEESAKRFEQLYEKLLREAKKAESERSSDLAELKKKNEELGSVKARAEEELMIWKIKFAGLEERVTKLEAETVEFENRNAENGAGRTILITDSDDDCAPRAASTEKETSPRVLKRSRSSSENVNEDENIVPGDSTMQVQARVVEVGGSSGDLDTPMVSYATNDRESQNIPANHGQGVLGPPKMRDLTGYRSFYLDDEFDEFKVTSSSSDSDSE